MENDKAYLRDINGCSIEQPGIYEKHNYAYPSGKKGYLIVEYTKTTD